MRIKLLGFLRRFVGRLSRAPDVASSLIRLEDGNPQAVFISDANGIVTQCNAAAGQLVPALDLQTTPVSVLSGAVADPIDVVRILQAKLDVTGNGFIKKETRNARVEVYASRLQTGGAIWRVSTIHQALPNDQNDAPLSLTFGRNGSVLSVSSSLLELLGSKPKNLRDIMSWPLPSSSGTVRLRTKAGASLQFAMLRKRTVGRCELNLFPLPAEGIADGQFADVPIALIQIEGDGTIRDANQSAKCVLGRKDLKGVNIDHVLRDFALPAAVDAGSSSPKSVVQFVKLAKAGSEKVIQVSINPKTHAPDAPMVAVLQDATELKSMEAQFVQSQKMQAIGQLAGGVAHDFNNLLTAISGHCDLLLLRHDAEDPDYSDLEQIRQNSNRAAALVGQLLAFSRKQTLQPQILDLEQTLSDHTHLLNRLVGEKMTLALTHGANMRRIRADRRQLEQVIMNLVVNARDAMAGEGVINITTSKRSYTAPEHRHGVTIPAGEYCVIAVSDEGTGIAPDQLPHIFEPFFTTKSTHEGTGLGLSTVYGIMKQTGGYVFADSVLGVGTTFELVFPAYSDPEPKLSDQTDQTEEDISTKSEGVVLLVEDEAPVRAFASRALQLKGFSVLEAANAEDALSILKDETLAVDIFVTDVVMPGADGPTWVSEALKKRPKTKVVFVSGYAENRFDAMDVDIPDSVFLPKPFSLNQLTSTVARLH